MEKDVTVIEHNEFYIMNRKVYTEIIAYTKVLTPYVLRQVIHLEHGMLFNAYKIYNKKTNENDELVYEENFAEGDMYLPIVHQIITDYIAEYIVQIIFI